MTDAEIEKLAVAIVAKGGDAFHIEGEKHYNSHKRLDALLDVYDKTTSTVLKALIGLFVVGAMIIAGIGAMKGH
jgi:hypothetical protein